MSAGELREALAFGQRAIVSDGYGNVEGDFVEEFTVAARVQRKNTGGETVQAARLAGRDPVTIVVRYSSDTVRIATDWRARDVRSGAIYNIRHAANIDERRRYIHIQAEAGVAV